MNFTRFNMKLKIGCRSQGAITPCQNLNSPFALFGLNFNFVMNQLTLIRPLEAAGGFY